MNVPAPIKSLQDFYKELTLERLDRLPLIYRENIHFIDPIHELNGLPALDQYFRDLMVNTSDCRFELQLAQCDDHKATMVWTMVFRHPRLGGGREIEVDGVSLLKFDDRIYFHRDYYDVSAMLHDHVPLLGSISRHLKQRISA